MENNTHASCNIERLDELRRHAVRQAAHVARTDLAVCLGRLELAGQLAEGDLAERLVELAASMRSVRNDLELLSRAGAWSVLGAPTRFEVGATIQRVLAEHATKATDRDAELVGANASQAPAWVVNAPHLDWAVSALTEQVLEQARPGDRVRLTSTADDNGRVDLTAGFERRSIPDELATMARPENQATLAAVEAVVAQAGGTFRMEAPADGRGQWTISLPVGDDASANAPSAPEQPSPRANEPPRQRISNATRPASEEPSDPSTPTVLVVEDHPDMRALLLDMLEPGHRVTMAASAEEALALLEQDVPNIVLCDLKLPGDDGESLITTIRSRPAWADLAIIVVSGRRDPDLKARLLRQGADDYLVKGFPAEELRARIANLAAAHFGIEDLRSRVSDAQKLTEQLQGALDSRVLVEQAKGFLAGEREVSVDEAFTTLRQHARAHNIKLRDVADRVVNQGFRPSG